MQEDNYNRCLLVFYNVYDISDDIKTYIISEKFIDFQK